MNLEELEKLIKLVEKSEIAEIEITRFGQKIRISKTHAKPGKAEHGNPASAQLDVETVSILEKKTQEAKAEEKKVEERLKNTVPITSPIVGTFYLTPAPDAQPYVEVGDIVKPGQVVCIIEAMKLMNEIESEIAGRIIKICVKNEEPVEYGQELFRLERM